MRPSPTLTLPLMAVMAACGKQPVEPRSPEPASEPAPVTSSAIEVVVGDPVSAPLILPVVPTRALSPTPAPAPPTPEPLADAAVEPALLPKAWTAPSIPGLTFADALRKARGARDAFARLVPPATKAQEASIKAWFAQAQTFVDQASRMYAASFHAPDAPRDGRIDAIAEAAELDMTMARSLDDAGLGAMPVAWRADPAVMSTFEDIAIGPTRRWRDEARVLARQCVDTARDSGVVTDAARRCAALRTGTPQKAKRGPDPGAGCACSPGDPLCSASLGGWCGAPKP
jgi:hypothetical protein